MKTCGSCVNGALVMFGNGDDKGYIDVQRCDDCKVFKTDEQAASYLWALATGMQALTVDFPGLEMVGDVENEVNGADLVDAVTSILDVAAHQIPKARADRRWTPTLSDQKQAKSLWRRTRAGKDLLAGDDVTVKAVARGTPLTSVGRANWRRIQKQQGL